jgi:8-hydroxy-5-deazaflavin:NADPH oxidoreductase
VAWLAVAGGHEVVLSNSRGPETLKDLATQLGPHARAATAGEAAEGGEIILVSVPLKAYPSRPATPVVGKVVMDPALAHWGPRGCFPGGPPTVGETD